MKLPLIIFTLLIAIACKNKQEEVPLSVKKSSKQAIINDSVLSVNQVSATNYTFYADSVFHGQKQILKYYLSKYGSDTCTAIKRNMADVIADFEGLSDLGFIRKQAKCSVFVLPPLNYCNYTNEDTWDGESYYFTDTTLPRLHTDSYCCHPSNIFLVGDIDEDGISELGQYFSSCSSRFKSIFVWTLKNNQWKKIGRSTFDQRYMNYKKPFSQLVKKTSKNKFKMFEITDSTDDSTKIRKPNWKEFSM